MTSERHAFTTPKDLPGSGWYELLPPVDSFTHLNKNVSADVVVVGAGFAGLTAVRRLLQHDPNMSVVLLEAQRLAFGACGRNSGFMIDLPHELQSSSFSDGVNTSVREIELNRTALNYALSMAEDFGLQDFAERRGKLHGAADAVGVTSLQNFSNDLKSFDEPHELLDAAQLQTITGSSFYQGGIYTPGCVMLQPAAYIRGLALGLAERYPSLSIYENSPAITIQEGESCVVKTAEGRIEAKKIVLAINGQLGAFGLYPRRLMHVFTFSSMTRKLTSDECRVLGGRNEWDLISAHPMGSTVRRTRDDRIVVRNTFTYNPNMATTETQVKRFAPRHKRSFERRFPMLSDVTMQHSWGGHLCLSRNSVAAFGEVEKNVFVSGCHNGLGTCKGTLGGLLIADLVTETANPMINDLVNAPAMSKLPPEPFASIGARAYLGWQQLRVGIDR